MRIQSSLITSLLLSIALFGGVFVDGALAQSVTVNQNILRMALHVSGMGNLDPHFAASSQDRAFADMVFNGLLRYVPGEAPLIEPDLAQSIPQFEMVGNRQVWTVKLKNNIFFHDSPGSPGYEMSADDVVFSLKKSADSQMSAYAGSYSDFKVEKIDKYAIRIILDKPLSPVLFLPKLTNYAGGFILPGKMIERLGYPEFFAHPVGTGPFQFESYQKGAPLVLKANEKYFRGQPQLDGVEVHFYPDITERTKALLSGEIDVIAGSGEKGWAESVMENTGVLIDSFGVGEVLTIYFNTGMKPFDDIRVRRAVTTILDRRPFLQTTNTRLSGPVYSPVPEMYLSGGLTKTELDTFGLTPSMKIDEARDLLTQAGYQAGFSLDLVTSEKRIYKSLYRVLAEELKKLNIVCEIKEVKHSEMHRIIRQEPLPLVIYGAWRPNADAYLTRFFHSDSIVITGEKPDTNFSRYAGIDKLIEDARQTIYPEQQINLWKQAQIKILSDAVAFPLIFTRQIFVRKSIVDYGHSLKSTMALYPQITEHTMKHR